MRLTGNTLGFVVNFLLGVAWASVLLGAFTSFFTFYHDSIFYAFLSAVMGMIPGMIGVLLIEHIITTKEKHTELQKQTNLLEEFLATK